MEKKDIFIFAEETIKEALKKLDKTAEKVLLVIDQDKRLKGTLTDGDVRRYLLKGNSLEGDISSVFNQKPYALGKKEFSVNKVRDIFLTRKIQVIPLVDENGRVVDFVSWNHVFAEDESSSISGALDVPVVVMAGGKGTRLDPFTRILPKPLIPIGDRPIIELIADEFRRQGAKTYYFILNYKAEMIESYFAHIEKDYRIEYIREPEFYGTAGALKLLEDSISDVFIVSNCDVMVKADFSEVVNFHLAQNASLTVLSSIQHHKIPYGVIEFKERGEVVDIREKPEYTVTINTGVYILDRDALKNIPPQMKFDMTDLMQSLLAAGKKVITYPVNESEYIDIGQWEEYKQSIERLTLFTKRI